jgi:hypothetical protein
MLLIKTTGILSIFVQLITGIVDAYALSIKVPSSILMLKQMLWIEFVVQIIEGIFYIWLIMQFFTKSVNSINITQFRYYDWPITTPAMLLTFSMYLLYIYQKEQGLITEGMTSGGMTSGGMAAKKQIHLIDNISKHWKILLLIIILDWIMLGFGYLGEMNIIPNTMAVIAGFIPFFIMFYLLYHHFAKLTTIGIKLFWYFAIVWSLYGVAALLKYVYKNAFYNILDLFAKNFFGLFLAFVLLSSR